MPHQVLPQSAITSIWVSAHLVIDHVGVHQPVYGCLHRSQEPYQNAVTRPYWAVYKGNLLWILSNNHTGWQLLWQARVHLHGCDCISEGSQWCPSMGPYELGDATIHPLKGTSLNSRCLFLCVAYIKSFWLVCEVHLPWSQQTMTNVTWIPAWFPGNVS